MEEICERCGEVADNLNDDLVCFDCLVMAADFAVDAAKDID